MLQAVQLLRVISAAAQQECVVQARRQKAAHRRRGTLSTLVFIADGATYAAPAYAQRTLAVDLGPAYDPNKRHVLLVDATGLKVFGEGEWKVRTHGKRRTWRKVHLLVDRESGHILEVATTEACAGDAPTARTVQLGPVSDSQCHGGSKQGESSFRARA